ncbi:hypothetical protein [Paraburkholderia sp. RL18-103-BIB-C]|uniref:hypothetical protein n=1 Tax=Paraburkholderia sp. RL18-103-BIB-C TaxID=3031637 RepID=UPI0038BBE752
MRAVFAEYAPYMPAQRLTQIQIDARATAAFNAGLALGAYSRLTSNANAGVNNSASLSNGDE